MPGARARSGPGRPGSRWSPVRPRVQERLEPRPHVPGRHDQRAAPPRPPTANHRPASAAGPRPRTAARHDRADDHRRPQVRLQQDQDRRSARRPQRTAPTIRTGSSTQPGFRDEERRAGDRDRELRELRRLERERARARSTGPSRRPRPERRVEHQRQQTDADGDSGTHSRRHACTGSRGDEERDERRSPPRRPGARSTRSCCRTGRRRATELAESTNTRPMTTSATALIGAARPGPARAARSARVPAPTAGGTSPGRTSREAAAAPCMVAQLTHRGPPSPSSRARRPARGRRRRTARPDPGSRGTCPCSRTPARAPRRRRGRPSRTPRRPRPRSSRGRTGDEPANTRANSSAASPIATTPSRPARAAPAATDRRPSPGRRRSARRRAGPRARRARRAGSSPSSRPGTGPSRLGHDLAAVRQQLERRRGPRAPRPAARPNASAAAAAAAASARNRARRRGHGRDVVGRPVAGMPRRTTTIPSSTPTSPGRARPRGTTAPAACAARDRGRRGVVGVADVHVAPALVREDPRLRRRVRVRTTRASPGGPAPGSAAPTRADGTLRVKRSWNDDASTASASNGSRAASGERVPDVPARPRPQPRGAHHRGDAARRSSSCRSSRSPRRTGRCTAARRAPARSRRQPRSRAHRRTRRVCGHAGAGHHQRRAVQVLGRGGRRPGARRRRRTLGDVQPAGRPRLGDPDRRALGPGAAAAARPLRRARRRPRAVRERPRSSGAALLLPGRACTLIRSPRGPGSPRRTRRARSPPPARR